MLDCAYVDRQDGAARFRSVRSPTSRELTRLMQIIARRVGRFLERRDLLERAEVPVQTVGLGRGSRPGSTSP